MSRSIRWRRASELSAEPPSQEEIVQRWLDKNRREIEAAMMCEVSSEIDRASHSAVVEIPKHHAPDMSGCIAVVQRLDPRVEQIDVFSGGDPDTRYSRSDNGWTAFRLSWK